MLRPMSIAPIKDELSPLLPGGSDDGDGFARSQWLEKEWLVLDTMGAVRNSLGAAAAFSSVPSGIIGTIPILQVLGGGMILHSALSETLPKSFDNWVKAIKCNEKEGHEEGVISTGLGFANQALYLGIGGLLTAAGITALLGPDGANAFSYSPIISSAATEAIANIGLGAACIIRGGVMLGRALYNLDFLNEFQKTFRQSLESGSNHEKIESSKTYLRNELDKGKERLIRRAGKEAVEALEKAFTEGATENQWKGIIEQIDRGIFKQKLMQYLTFLIGLLMVLGGIGAIMFCSGGLVATFAVGSSCVLFASMESLWIPYDSTPAFNWLVEKLYNKPKFWEEQTVESNCAATALAFNS